MPKGLKIFLTPQQAEDIASNPWMSEHLRYAGVVSRPERGFDGRVSFRLYNPREAEFNTWAEMNIGRLRSFGIVAEKFKL